MISLKNKVVMITGASSGIGEACARQFAALGVHLVLGARRLERLESLKEELEQEYDVKVHILQLDVRDLEQVQRGIEDLPQEFARIDILVNNAGLAKGLEKLHEARIENWEQMIDTNVKGLLYVSRTVIPRMVQRGEGHIINIGSIAGHEAYVGGSVYCATKHAVDAITKSMRMDLVDTPIRVSTIDPGMVETEFGKVRFDGDEARVDKFYEGIEPLAGEDIADAVVYCATRPKHVSINEIILMPVSQASATVVHRK